jgi:hypothetical protein
VNPLADSYSSISQIANDRYLNERMRACATQQAHLGAVPGIGSEPDAALAWVDDQRYVWASSPGWGGAWDSALAGHPGDPNYQPGNDPAVITDEMILSTVQTLGGA